MLTLYTWGTPNGRKPLILLEELELPYELVRVDIGAGEQRSPDFLRINPNGKIPALYDAARDLPIFESGAILVYLAEKTGRFLSTDPSVRARELSWLFLQTSAVGPVWAQANWFASRPDASHEACEHFRTELIRLYGILDARLAEAPFLGGECYGIADIATWPWIYLPSAFRCEPGTFRHVDAWTNRITARPAVQSAMAVSFP